MKKTGFLIAALSALAAVFAFTTKQSWKIKDNYSIQFSNSDVNGIFKKASGNISFDETDLAGSKFDFSIEVSSINTGNGLQNKHAKGAEWFDAVKYPYIKYTSSKIEKSGSSYKVTGTLEMKGVKKDLSFPFSFKKNGNDATFNADFSVNKNDFNVGKKGDSVGEIIKLKISVPVNKS
jgi:polyisoprenoid-binding protein YceI